MSAVLNNAFQYIHPKIKMLFISYCSYCFDNYFASISVGSSQITKETTSLLKSRVHMSFRITHQKLGTDSIQLCELRLLKNRFETMVVVC